MWMEKQGKQGEGWLLCYKSYVVFVLFVMFVSVKKKKLQCIFICFVKISIRAKVASLTKEAGSMIFASVVKALTLSQGCIMRQ